MLKYFILSSAFMLFVLVELSGHKTFDDDLPTITEKSVGDIDSDGIMDTIYYDAEKELLVCRLSSLDYETLTFDFEMLGDHNYIYASEGGFTARESHMRSENGIGYEYIDSLKDFRIVYMADENYGNALNDGSGSTEFNLVTGKFVANWSYWDWQADSLIDMPTIKVYVENPPIYLSDSLEINYPDQNLFDEYKKADLIARGYDADSVNQHPW